MILPISLLETEERETVSNEYWPFYKHSVSGEQPETVVIVHGREFFL